MKNSRSHDEMQTRQSLSLNLIEPELLLLAVFLFCLFTVCLHISSRKFFIISSSRREGTLWSNKWTCITSYRRSELNGEESKKFIQSCCYYYYSSLLFLLILLLLLYTQRQNRTSIYTIPPKHCSHKITRVFENKKKFFIFHSSNFRELHTKSRFLSLL